MPTRGRSIADKILPRLLEVQALMLRMGRAKPEAVRRWVELKMRPASVALGRRIVRPRLHRRERARMQAADKAIAAALAKLAEVQDGGLDDSRTIFNVALHFLLAERDIQALKVDMLTHPDAWMRGLAMRVTLLTIYEWDLDEVTGRRFREALSNLGIPEASKEDMTKALRAVRKTRERITKRFGDLRNNAIAHRGADAVAQYKLIADLRQEEVLPLVAEFYDAVHLFVGALPDVMLVAGSLSAYLKQMFKNS